MWLALVSKTFSGTTASRKRQSSEVLGSCAGIELEALAMADSAAERLNGWPVREAGTNRWAISAHAGFAYEQILQYYQNSQRPSYSCLSRVLEPESGARPQAARHSEYC